ncbi:hypothetical protein AB4298_20795 [Shewanella sp. 10N.261.52.F9]|uniref:hypothetical protein n=1 Tax=Shewanella sp. 10N.261.52.F9 TaxID=3229684 RepID=UPI00354E68E9
MNINAYSDFVEISTTTLLDCFKLEFRDIPTEIRQCKLNQGYQALARNAGFSGLEAMKAQSSVLLTMNEFVAALESSGVKKQSWSTNEHIAQLLESDVQCTFSQGDLCVAIHDNGEIIETPYYANPSPYSPALTFYVLPVDANGAWLTYDEWYRFILDLRKNLNFDDNIDSQIEDIWNAVNPDHCGELFLSEQPDWDELTHCSEGLFRQRILKHSGHTPLDLLYDYFSSERTS